MTIMRYVDIDKKRFKTPFLTLWNHFENRTSIASTFLQHLRLCHVQNLHFAKNDKSRPQQWSEENTAGYMGSPRPTR